MLYEILITKSLDIELDWNCDTGKKQRLKMSNLRPHPAIQVVLNMELVKSFNKFQ